jgi:simple sugar transport system ATP-binding protein
MDRSPPLLEMRGMSKRFGPVWAVIDVSLTLHKGEILGLVGDNAAGKSTLMKLLTAVHRPDAGQVLIDGQPVNIDSPRTARRLGIEMIYQDFSLAPNLNVVENIFLGRELSRAIAGIRIVDRRRMASVARHALQETHMRFDSVQDVVADLSGGQQQAVAIARALAFDARVVIMDEPTASLSVKAIPPLLEIMRQLRSSGMAMIFITHRIKDLFDTCDRVMVLRRGSMVGESPIARTSIDEVTAMITGSREKFGSTPDHSVAR